MKKDLDQAWHDGAGLHGSLCGPGKLTLASIPCFLDEALPHSGAQILLLTFAQIANDRDMSGSSSTKGSFL